MRRKKILLKIIKFIEYNSLCKINLTIKKNKWLYQKKRIDGILLLIKSVYFTIIYNQLEI